MGIEEFANPDSSDDECVEKEQDDSGDTEKCYTNEDELNQLNDDMLRGKESPQHAIAKREKAVELVNEGYTVWFEKRFEQYIIDVYAEKDDDVLLIEVGTTSRQKVNNLRSIDGVTLKNIPYDKDGEEVCGIVNKSRNSTASAIRPKIPGILVSRMETPSGKMYEGNEFCTWELGGCISKTEFINWAVREKLDELENKYNIEQSHHLKDD